MSDLQQLAVSLSATLPAFGGNAVSKPVPRASRQSSTSLSAVFVELAGREPDPAGMIAGEATTGLWQREIVEAMSGARELRVVVTSARAASRIVEGFRWGRQKNGGGHKIGVPPRNLRLRDASPTHPYTKSNVLPCAASDDGAERRLAADGLGCYFRWSVWHKSFCADVRAIAELITLRWLDLCKSVTTEGQVT